MSAHTPGPWRKQDRYIMTVVGGREVLLAAADSMEFPGDQVLANARLIAAAPDLLAACQAIMDPHSYHGTGELWSNVRNQVRAAVIKAEGK